MTLKKMFWVMAALLATTGYGSTAQAELVTYEFTAVVTRAKLKGDTLGDPGDVITGTVTIDDGTPDRRRGPRVGKYKDSLESWSVHTESNRIEGSGGNVVVRDRRTEQVRIVDHDGHGTDTTVDGEASDYGSFRLMVGDRTGDDLLDGDDIPDLSSLTVDGSRDRVVIRVGDNGKDVIKATLTSITRVGDAASVPELDPSAGGSALALVVGGAVVLQGRRRRVG